MSRVPGQPVIRAAGASDAAPLGRLARETYAAAFGDSMDPADLAAHLELHLSADRVRRMLEEDSVLVAEIDGELIGFIQFGASPYADDLPGLARSDDKAIQRLYVRSEHQGRGIGTRLMLAAREALRSAAPVNLYLDVWEENHAALRFYARHGFTRVGERRFQVASGAECGVDAILHHRLPPTD